MRCDSVMIRLDELVSGELDPRQATKVREHLTVCKECDEDRETVERLAEALPNLVCDCPVSCKDELKEKLDHGYGQIETPVGPVWVAFSSKGLTRVTPAWTPEKEFVREYARRLGHELERVDVPAELIELIGKALRGEKLAKPAVDISALPGFEQKVLRKLGEIPPGEVRTYAWVAREAGNPAAVRAVGNACARNPVPFVVPCHRVVPTSGGLGNYALGGEMKRDLLAREGIDVDEIDRLGREHVRYVGSKTTHIYCFPTCRDARRIREENRVYLRDEADAAKQGFRPCLRCRPVAKSA